MSAPTIKQSLADLVSQRFPWLLHVVTVALDKGRGLALRTASGLLYLAGGPDDPAVHRKGDAGTAGTISATGNVVTITAADGSIFTLTFVLSGGAIAITGAPPSPPFNLATKSTEGSDWVTCK